MSVTKVRIPFKPNPGQEPFIRDRFKVKHRHLIGGTGSGKTFCGVFEVIMWCILCPGIVGIICEPNYKMIKRNLIPIFNRLLGNPFERNPLIRDYHRTDNTIEFVNGSKVWLIGMEEPENAEGQSVDFWYLDESRLVHDLETTYLVLDRRLRGSGAACPIGSWETTTPDAPGSILHKRTENPSTKVDDGAVYRVSLYDNERNLPKGYIASIEKAHTGAMAERFIWGRFSYVGGGLLGFDGEAHVVDIGQYPDSGVDQIQIVRMVYGVDWGWDNPTAIIATGLDGDRRAYAIEEVYQRAMSDEDIADALKDMMGRYSRGVVYCGHDEPKSIEKLRTKGIDARIRGSPKVEDGVREIGSRFKKEGDGRYRLYIGSQCSNLISELQIYTEENQKKGVLHATDALRYSLSDLITQKPYTTLIDL